MRCCLSAILLTLGLSVGCGTDKPSGVPLEVKAHFPAPEALKISVPGQSGAAGSGREAVFLAVQEAVAAQRSLELLQQYLQQGGEVNRDLSVTIAIEGAPRVVDQVVRYSRDPSRLDLERQGDHAFFYLQYDWGYGFDPDQAVGESRMVMEGSSFPSSKPGTRVKPTAAAGLSSTSRGYLRFHFNHRPEDTDASRAAAQLDYDLDKHSLHFTYFPAAGAEGDLPVAFWQRTDEQGIGFVYASRRDEKGLHYSVLAQYQADGAMAVWDGEGKLWGCYDGAGQELGNLDNPTPCDSFTAKFETPPASTNLWPALPAGLP